jgi:hypothetical protein
MAHVDDLIERRPQQVLLTVVSRSSHARPNAVHRDEGITNRQKSESQNARN